MSLYLPFSCYPCEILLPYQPPEQLMARDTVFAVSNLLSFIAGNGCCV